MAKQGRAFPRQDLRPGSVVRATLRNNAEPTTGDRLVHASLNTFPFVPPYSPPFLALIFVWAIWVVIADRMWRHCQASSVT
jgi:hypothetical protein